MRVLFIIIFISNFCFSQNKQGTIFYKKQTKDKNFKNQSNKEIHDMIRKADELVVYKLNFNDSSSVFEKEKAIFNDTKSLSLSRISSAGYNGIVFRNNFTKSILRQNETGGETFIIKYPYQYLKWQLTNETKKIGKYLCYKAVSIKKEKNSKGQLKEKIIIGWYSPEIPVNFGPHIFGELPGLILELETERQIFYATKIILNNSKVKFLEPKKGIEVTVKLYDSIIRGLTTNVIKK